MICAGNILNSMLPYASVSLVIFNCPCNIGPFIACEGRIGDVVWNIDMRSITWPIGNEWM